MLRFCVRYSRPADLVADFETQFQKGGLLVRVAAPPELKQFSEAELVLETISGTLVLPAQVAQVVADAGIALLVDATDAGLLAAVEEARGAGESAGDPPIHSVISGEQRAEPAESANPSGPAARIHAALHGNKEERTRILRGGDRRLHHYVLRNPGLGIDEVTSIAKMATVTPDLLKVIAERPEWIGRPEIALALVRNPKTPTPLAIRMLKHVSSAELRRLAKSNSARMQILRAARKMVVG